jgi:DNA-3-methyladenine glycosylase II
MVQSRRKKNISLRNRPSDRTIAQYLCAADPKLLQVIKNTAKLPEYYRQKTHFETISRIIVGQQLSYRAAESIWRRLKGQFRRWTPQLLCKASVADLRREGLSVPKAAFISELGCRIVAGEVSLQGLEQLKEQEVLDRLRTIKGFGPWSREMFLIFALEYPDVFSCGDAGLRRAISALYSVPEREYGVRAAEIAERWKPFRSYACRYLWLWLDSSSKLS